MIGDQRMANKDGFGSGLDQLDENMGQTSRMTAEFEAELARLRQSMSFTSREVGTLTAAWSGAFTLRALLMLWLANSPSSAAEAIRCISTPTSLPLLSVDRLGSQSDTRRTTRHAKLIYSTFARPRPSPRRARETGRASLLALLVISAKRT